MELYGFRVQNCGLRHESFKEVSGENGCSVSKWRRVGFCHKNIRDGSLSCAHSMSWFSFLNELKKNQAFYRNESVQASLQRMEGLRVKIFELDHQKGELEKRKLENRDRKVESAALEELLDLYDSVVEKMEAELKFLKDQRALFK